MEIKTSENICEDYHILKFKKWVAVDEILISLMNMRKATEENHQFELLDNIINKLSKCQD